MKKTIYLYGIFPSELEDKEYFEALKFKEISGIKLYRTLFLKHDKTKEENDRMFYVNKAVQHTQKLLDERTA